MKKIIFSVLLYTLVLILSFSCITNKDGGSKEEVPETIFGKDARAMPMEYRGHIYLQGEMDSLNGNFVFDTGAHNLYLDSLFLTADILKHQGYSIMKGILPGAGNSYQEVKIIKDSIDVKFGKYSYKTNTVPIFSLKTILGDFADGIIGWDLVSGKILEINYIDQYIIIHQDIDSLDLNGYTKIKYEFINNKLFMPLIVEINDSLIIEDKFLIDLGSGNSIIFTSPVALKHGFSKKINEKIRFYSGYKGVGGESESYLFLAKSLNIGGHRLENFVSEYSTDSKGALSTSEHAGLLGNEIFDKFDVIIDFQSDNIYIKPNSSFDESFKIPGLGFSYVDRNKTLGAFIVTGLYENSSAEKNGLKIDDRIIEINNIPVDELYYKKMKQLLNEEKVLNLKVERQSQLFNIEIIQEEIININ